MVGKHGTLVEHTGERGPVDTLRPGEGADRGVDAAHHIYLRWGREGGGEESHPRLPENRAQDAAKEVGRAAKTQACGGGLGKHEAHYAAKVWHHGIE